MVGSKFFGCLGVDEDIDEYFGLANWIFTEQSSADEVDELAGLYEQCY
jgi:hypothetical protein